ncbi:MAG: glycosyltransferase [Acetobacter aceti]|nr:glycosyltransferase [Acetobacter aceti]
MSNTPHILQVMAARGHGGAELYSTDVILGLHKAGVRQTVVLHPDAPRLKELEDAGLAIETDILKRPVPLWRKWRMTKLVRQLEPSLIHCWMRRAAESMPANASHLSGNRPVIGWFGNYRDLKPYTHCTHLVGCTPDIAERMRADPDWHPADNATATDRIFSAPTFSSVTPEPALPREELDTPQDARVLLTLSRLHEAKGLETLISAMQQLPDCYLWMAGDGPLRAALEEQARQEGVTDRIRFAGWRTDRGALLAASDICVLPSRYEPFGTVILDAWSTKTPLVACAAAGPRAYVRTGENGMLTPIDDLPALVSALRSVLDDSTLRDRIVSGGLADYEHGFTPQAVIDRWRAIYDTCLSSV